MDTHGRYPTGVLGKKARPKVIELHQLTLIQAQQPLLHEMSLTIFEGESVALLGSSETEKHALLACLLGQVQPAQGEVRVLSASLPPLPGEIRRQIGVMPQNVDRKTHETVAAHLQRFSAYHGVQLTRTQISQYCSHYQLAPDTLVKELSEFQARVLALALALVHDPRLALLVEPFTGLGASDQAILQNYLQQIQREGRTLLCTGIPLDEKLFSGYDLKVSLKRGRIVHQNP